MLIKLGKLLWLKVPALSIRVCSAWVGYEVVTRALGMSGGTLVLGLFLGWFWGEHCVRTLMKIRT